MDLHLILPDLPAVTHRRHRHPAAVDTAVAVEVTAVAEAATVVAVETAAIAAVAVVTAAADADSTVFTSHSAYFNT